MGLYVLEAGRSLGWRRSSATNASSSQQLRMAYDRGEPPRCYRRSLLCALPMSSPALTGGKTGEPAPGQSAERAGTRRTPRSAAHPVQRTPELAADIQAAHYTGNHERADLGGPPHQGWAPS